jgi:hypothetical protein
MMRLLLLPLFSASALPSLTLIMTGMMPLFYAYLGQRGGGDVSRETGKTNSHSCNTPVTQLACMCVESMSVTLLLKCACVFV